MRITTRSTYGEYGQFVLLPDIAIDDYRTEWAICIGWLFWSISFRFKKKAYEHR